MVRKNRRKSTQALNVSSSGYIAWKDRPVSDREKQNKLLVFHIRAIHNETDATYGTPRITRELNDTGIPCRKNRIARIKQKMRLRAIAAPRKFRSTFFGGSSVWEIC